MADAQYRRQVTLAQRTAVRVRGIWAQVDRGSVFASWRALLADVLPVVASAQGIAAASAGAYVDDALEAQGVVVEAEGRVSVTALAGVASDGRDLAALLAGPAVRALEAVGRGRSVPVAMAVGAGNLDMIVRTQVADAGRVATGVAIAARPAVGGYVRMLSQPSCSRCIVLAGRVYEWNAGFKRHPMCDCRHIPTAENVAGDVLTSPRAAFDAMDRAEQDRVFTQAGAEAIREGADIARVVNARRGMRVAGERLVTTEAAGRRVRLMPEQIFRDAKDRADAIRLLRLHKYLI